MNTNLKVFSLYLFIFTVVLSFFSCKPSQPATSSDAEDTSASNTSGEIHNVSVVEFDSLTKVLKGNYLLLDVRSPEEWSEGIMPGATLINYYDDSFSQSLASLPKSDNILVYCKAGGRSSEAAEQLKNLGFKNIYNLDGGMDAWKEIGMTVVPNQ